jgi:glycerol-3-phosphate dehydrogenase (NAD(P)+)
MNITLLGAGAWGTALAMALSHRHPVMLWSRDAQAVEAMRGARQNARYLPGMVLPEAICISADLHEVIAHAKGGLLIVASSVAGLRPLASMLATHDVDNLVWLCKGLEEGTALLPHQVVHQVLGRELPAGALSGPSFAQEVARGLPCALTIGSHSKALREQVVSAVHGGSIRVYSTDDIIGVEVGGAVKNILAIATGIADGLGLGMNARAALITRGLAEITRLGTALGGRIETFMGLTGVGDLILTCTGDLSRNRQVGLRLASGQSLPAIIEQIGHVAEGVRCVQAVKTLAEQHGVDMPIIEAVVRVLFDAEPPAKAIAQLLARGARAEH